jgi:phospholipid/cholesterol/gamma-HCH transport system ATP-binding protein
VSDEIVKLRDQEQVTSIVVTHQIRDAYYMATHEAVRTAEGRLQIVKAGGARKAQVGFMVLHEGVIRFEGSAADLFASRDPFFRQFLYKTLPPW